MFERHKASDAVEEYLEAIHRFGLSAEGISTTRLADHLQVRPASVTGMLRRLREAGLITYRRYGEIALTPAGEVRAHDLIRRHRLAERLVTDVLKMPLERAHQEACRLEHALSPEVEARLAEALGSPDFCPHGHPIDAGADDDTLALTDAPVARAPSPSFDWKTSRPRWCTTSPRAGFSPARPLSSACAMRSARRWCWRWPARPRPSAPPSPAACASPASRSHDMTVRPVEYVRNLVAGRHCGGCETCPMAGPITRRKLLLFGSPNVGKSVVFNQLTGAYAVVSNYPGTTVEVSRGRATVGRVVLDVVDTPGTYSLSPLSEDEQVAQTMLLDEHPDLVLHVVDATHLSRMLVLTLQLIEAGVPVALDVNIIDEAERAGLAIDTAVLQRELAIPVVATAAAHGVGVERLRALSPARCLRRRGCK